jgi:SOS response regulatory protein OraA/RecX
MAAAARLLERRARSIAEVRRRLTEAGYPAGLIAGAVERLIELGMLDDEAFARAWVASRDRAHPRGERALRHELRVKGIAPEIVTSVLDERARPGDNAGGEGATDAGEGEPHAHRAAPDQPSGSGRPVRSGDATAAERLLARSARTLARLADPRRRRQRAWAMLARAGFDVATAGEAVAALEREWTDGDPADG